MFDTAKQAATESFEKIQDLAATIEIDHKNIMDRLDQIQTDLVLTRAAVHLLLRRFPEKAVPKEVPKA